MRTTVRRAEALDIRAYELAPVGRVVAELQPQTLDVIADAKAILVDLAEACSSAPRSTPAVAGSTDTVLTSLLPFERAIDATVAMTKHGSYTAVDEIGFLARIELGQRAERLARLTAGHGAYVILGECDSSLRRVRKALNAVDAAIGRAEGIAPVLDFTSELQTSLAVRRAYAKLRRRILAGPEPTPATIRARIRSVGTQIAVLIGWDVYPEMRVRDRLLLRELQQRALAWLREGDSAATDEGLRLWQDVASSVEMFSLVNRRQELVEHDRVVVRDVLGQLDASDRRVDRATWHSLIGLIGLDAELDVELAEREPPTCSAIRPVLERLAERLGLLHGPPRAVP